MLSELPRFYAAKRYGTALLILGALFAILGFAFFRLATSAGGVLWYTQFAVPRAVGYLGPAFWIAAAGLVSAGLMALARNHVFAAEHLETPAPRSYSNVSTPQTGYRKLLFRASELLQKSRKYWPKPAVLAGWPQSLVAALFGAAAIWGVTVLWRAGAGAPDSALNLQIFAAAIVIALAFPLLILERQYANISTELLPEAGQIDRLLRVPLTACLVLAAAAAFTSAGFGWAKYLQNAVVLLLFVIGIELVLRSAVLFFVPYLPMETRRAVADSSLARFVLRLSIPNVRTINVTVQNTLGIDLSRSWALAFLRQAALPVLAGLGVFSWCVTGLTGLSANQRGIYERFGVPIEVLGPGVHAHLPWPFGTVRVVEYGVIHQLPIEFVLPGGEEKESSTVDSEAVAAGAEGPAPESADRLWTDAHPFEGSYLIANQVDGKQSFQLVDVDMTVIYRVGLTDQAARNVAYRISSPDDFIQAVSGQLITRYFARHTLLDVIGSSREAFTIQFQKDLQTELDNANSGIEAISVSIEAVHPPPGAAGAYHDVQAAGIRAETEVFTSQGNATRQLSIAQMTADSDHNASVAAAAETVGQAKADATLFDADRKAYAAAGRGFLLERWLDNLTKALNKNVPLVLVDHRLKGEDVPTLDMRLPGGAAGSGAIDDPNARAPSDPNVLPGYEELQSPAKGED